MPFGLWARMGPGNRVLDGVQIPHEKVQFWGKGSPIVKYRDFLPWAVQKRLNRLICYLGCELGWAEGSTSSIVFARWWRQYAQFQSYSPGGANVPNNTAMSCATMVKPIDLPFGLWTWVGQKTHKFNYSRQVASVCPHGRHIGATWWT